MEKVRIGVYIEDRAYKDRFIRYLLKHCKDKIELYVYTEPEKLAEDQPNVSVLLTDSTYWDDLNKPVICLVEEQSERKERGSNVYCVDKYQDANNLVEQIMSRVGEEVKLLQRDGNLNMGTRIVAVYSLADCQFQLPFSLMLTSILSEKEKVLMVDLQENSGLSKLSHVAEENNLEDLLVMSQTERVSVSRINACIGHLDRGDYVYPVENTERLCEIDQQLCNSMIQMLCSTLDYDVIVLNMGVRFKGFFDVMNRCSDIYLVQKNGGLSQWREYEFLQEISRRGYRGVADRIKKIEPPIVTTALSYEKLVETWKWNDFGDKVRAIAQGVGCAGRICS